MRPDKHARHYAQALFNVARRTDSILAVRDSLLVVAYLLKKDALFKVFFQTPRIKPVDKVAVLGKILQGHCHAIVAEFFALLSERKEWKLLVPTLRAYQVIQRATLDVITVTAYSASELDSAAVAAIEKVLKARLDKPVDFATVIEPELLGGLKLRIGNLFVDGSLATRLKRLRHDLLQS
ncbi:MAG: ATP synthase F1 subunit delta [Candidatus Neomarinimicrobiota bacterium]